MKVLVAGGAGYVGGWLCDELAAAGHDVTVYDVLLYEDIYLKPVRFQHGDILDRDLLSKQLETADAVVWLAALVGDGACALDPGLTSRINLESVGWLADHYDGRIVFMSTCSVYGAQEGLLTEESALNPLSLYAQTKLEAEKHLEGRNAITFRLGTLFGVGDSYSRIRVDLVLNTLAVRAHLNRRMSVFGGKQYRPLLHVRDVATAVLPTLSSNLRGIFNLSASNHTILELSERVQRYVPDAAIEITEMKFQDSRNYRVSCDKAVSAFDFRPKYSIDDGILQVLQLMNEGRIRDVSSARFSNLDQLRPFLVPEASPLGSEVHVPHQFSRFRRI